MKRRLIYWPEFTLLLLVLAMTAVLLSTLVAWRP